MTVLVVHDGGVIAAYEWGSDQRLPVAGERLEIGPVAYQVEQVSWGLQQDQVSGTVAAHGATLTVGIIDW